MAKPIKCDICGAGPFKHPAPLGRHKRDAHGIPGTSHTTLDYHKAKQAAQTPEEALKARKLTCDICGAGPFKGPHLVGIHKKKEHGIEGSSASVIYKRQRRAINGATGIGFDRISTNLDALARVRKPNGGISLDEAISALETKRDSDYRAANEAIAYLKEMRNQ